MAFKTITFNIVMVNPQLVGYCLQSSKKDMLPVNVNEKGKPYKSAGEIDYVSAWYFNTTRFMQ